VSICDNLWLLPAGVALHGAPGILHEAPTTEFFLWARSRFDVVIVDSPPVLTTSDARALSLTADGTILVVRAGRTEPDAALRAKSLLESDGAHLLGVVLNSWDPRTSGSSKVASLAGYRAVA
jgi:Mrp family chromosome partitioning ATPase